MPAAAGGLVRGEACGAGADKAPAGPTAAPLKGFKRRPGAGDGAWAGPRLAPEAGDLVGGVVVAADDAAPLRRASRKVAVVGRIWLGFFWT